MENKTKTPIMCDKCMKESGYFIEDFICEKVDKPKYCKNCNASILDKPDFSVPIYN